VDVILQTGHAALGIVWYVLIIHIIFNLNSSARIAKLAEECNTSRQIAIEEQKALTECLDMTLYAVIVQLALYAIQEINSHVL
jgi:hypothetical protein